MAVEKWNMFLNSFVQMSWCQQRLCFLQVVASLDVDNHQTISRTSMSAN